MYSKRDDFIEVHQRRHKRLRRVSVLKYAITEIAEEKSGTAIRYLLRGEWERMASLYCVESYDEVLALLDKE